MASATLALIAAVESGGLAVSTAAILAGLPKDEQAKAVAGGLKQAAGKAREMRAAKSRGSPPACAPARFGVRRVATPGDPDDSGVEHVTFLWVPTSALADAIETLKRGGFECVGPV